MKNKIIAIALAATALILSAGSVFADSVLIGKEVLCPAFFKVQSNPLLFTFYNKGMNPYQTPRFWMVGEGSFHPGEVYEFTGAQNISTGIQENCTYQLVTGSKKATVISMPESNLAPHMTANSDWVKSTGACSTSNVDACPFIQKK